MIAWLNKLITRKGDRYLSRLSSELLSMSVDSSLQAEFPRSTASETPMAFPTSDLHLLTPITASPAVPLAKTGNTVDKMSTDYYLKETLKLIR